MIYMPPFSLSNQIRGIMEKKRCPLCEEEKPYSEFGSDANRSDGLSFYCLQCSSLQRKSSYILKSLRRWAERYESQCARCGRIDGLEHLWLPDEMIPVTICPDCLGLHESQTMNHEQFFKWLREKKCQLCGRAWIARQPKPAVCPRCKSSYWQGGKEA